MLQQSITIALVFLSRYDRQKLSLKEIHNVQYVACMNPTSGSFTISSRLQVGWAEAFPLFIAASFEFFMKSRFFMKVFHKNQF